MKKMRKIIEIDEERCNGCGQCIIACAEGALALVNGKAKLVSEIYCDGLGACIGECPEGALHVVEKEVEDFNEEAVKEHIQVFNKPKTHHDELETLPCGCPSSAMMTLKKGHRDTEHNTKTTITSELSHWPIKIQLLSPQAPFLKGADLVLLADCAGAAYPNLHRDILKNKAVAMGCPKLDNLDAHIIKLAEILKGARSKSLTVVHMEVPCCSAFAIAARKAINLSGLDIPLKRIIISRDGTILDETDLSGFTQRQCQVEHL